jgi:SAM-dependent methyltransferase
LICEACGGSDYSVARYKNPPGPVTLARQLKATLQWVGWRALPVMILPDSLVQRLSPGLFSFRHIKICKACGLGTVHPMPSLAALNRYYSNSYAALSPDRVITPLDATSNDMLRHRGQHFYLKERLAEFLTSSASSIEFGAGDGVLSRLVKLDFPHLQVSATEKSETSRRLLIENGFDTVFDDYDGPSEAFDLVMASHVLEHVNDAVTVLKIWHSWLKNGGKIFIEVPHGGHPDFYKIDLEALPHTYFFTPPSMRALAEKAGFEVEEVITGGKTWPKSRTGSAYVEPETWFNSAGEDGNLLRVILRKV